MDDSLVHMILNKTDFIGHLGIAGVMFCSWFKDFTHREYDELC